MIYVLIDGNRMKSLSQKLNALEIKEDTVFMKNDILILPLRWQNKIKQDHYLLNNLILFLPYHDQNLSKNNKVFAYMEDESLLLENAKLTALGIVNLLSSITSFYDMDIDLIGYGRCAKALIVLLDYLNVRYKIIYHKQNEHVITMDDYLSVNKGNILINTADSYVFENKDINFNEVKYIIDLSSKKPFKSLDDTISNKIIYPGPLPEIYFAHSSAQLIETFIRRKLNEEK